MLVFAGLVSVCDSSVQAGLIIDTVPVGNAGNAADTRYSAMGFGSVGYTFNLGKYEVTAGQYTVFLNAVAATDTYGLYNPAMGVVSDFGANIQRSGSLGAYSYTVAADWADRPVNYVNWGDAARFANWMHNGQPTGAQDLSTTEDGSYFLNGATSNTALLAVARNLGATWVIPTEDEWYKAAYHKNDGVTGNYWDYPMGSSAAPNNANPGGDTGHSGNYFDNDYTIGSPYWRSIVGFFGQSDSPYGTFDQGGNVWEWNEAIVPGSSESFRGVRGGSFNYFYYGLLASAGSYSYPTGEAGALGFRVAQVPEPSTIAMLALGSVGILTRCPRLRR